MSVIARTAWAYWKRGYSEVGAIISLSNFLLILSLAYENFPFATQIPYLYFVLLLGSVSFPLLMIFSRWNFKTQYKHERGMSARVDPIYEKLELLEKRMEAKGLI
jgi:hypothetical protein